MEEIYPENATYKTIIIPVSILMQYIYCNYKTYRMFGKGKGMRVEDVVTGKPSANLTKKHDVEVDGKTEQLTFNDVLERSHKCNSVFTFRNCTLSAEVIPGIILSGKLDRMEVWNGKVVITKSLLRDDDTIYEDDEKLLTAFALILRRYGIRFKDMTCTIEIYNKTAYKLLKKLTVDVWKYSELMRRRLWEMAMIAMKARVPRATTNANKCAKCELSESGECDRASVIRSEA